MQSKDPIDHALPPPRRPRLSKPRRNRLDHPSREISGLILMQMLPFVDKKCPQTFAASVCALFDVKAA